MSDQAGATERNVPRDYPSIQSAINATQNGDEVVIAPGSYKENIEIVNKYITVRSSGGAASTVLTGNPGKTIVMIQNVPFRQGGITKLSGLTIRGGNSPDGQGGGITIANSADPTIQDNIIEHNYSTVQGGGILVFNNSNPHIRNNTIRNNKAYMFGGGIFAVKNSSPTISENYIQNNQASGARFTNGGASGGAIYLENDTSNKSSFSTPVIFHNVITGNTADFAGGAMSLRIGVNAIIEDNEVSNNRAAYGGGIHVETEGSRPVIASNRITNNVAPYSNEFAGSGHGGGISIYATSYPEINDNVVSGNQSSHGGAGIVIAENARANINRNVISNNSAVDRDGVYEGGGLYIAHAYAKLTNNIFDSNSARVGGGIALINGSSTDILHNTIVNNQVSKTSNNNGDFGGGIFVANAGGITSNVVNNIISSNSSFQIFEDGAKARFDNNNITNSGLGLYDSYSTSPLLSAASLNGSSVVNASNNVDGNPAFVDSSNKNYHLTVSSQARSNGQSLSVREDKDNRIRSAEQPSDIGAYLFDNGSTLQKQNVFRFWSDANKSHFYTQSLSERNNLIFSSHPKEWKYEYFAYSAFANAQTDTIPLYRFWSQAHKGHFYTSSAEEKQYVVDTYPESTWRYEGIAYNVYPLSYSKPANTVDRFWSSQFNHHFYTIDPAESQSLRSNPSSPWGYEGPRFKTPL